MTASPRVNHFRNSSSCARRAAAPVRRAAPPTGGPSRARIVAYESGHPGPGLASRPASSTPRDVRRAAPPTGGPSRTRIVTYESGHPGDSVILRVARPRQPTRQLDPRDGPQRRCGGRRPQPAAPRARELTYESGHPGPGLASRPASSTPATGRSAGAAGGAPNRRALARANSGRRPAGWGSIRGP
jgi:hypothetical protein